MPLFLFFEAFAALAVAEALLLALDGCCDKEQVFFVSRGLAGWANWSALLDLSWKVTMSVVVVWIWSASSFELNSGDLTTTSPAVAAGAAASAGGSTDFLEAVCKIGAAGALIIS